MLFLGVVASESARRPRVVARAGLVLAIPLHDIALFGGKFVSFKFISSILLTFFFCVSVLGQNKGTTEGIVFIAKDDAEKAQIKKGMKELFEGFGWGEGQVVSHEEGSKVWYTLNSDIGETSTFDLTSRKDLKIEENLETFINSEGEEKTRPIATQKEIIAAMLQRGRAHEFSGKDASVGRLMDHVGVRQEIVRANKAAYWIFPEGKPAQKNPKVWNKDFTVKEGVDVLDALEDAWQGYKSKFGYEPGCTAGLKLIWIRGHIRYYTKKGDKQALDELRKLLGNDPLAKIEMETDWNNEGVEYVTKPSAFMKLHSKIPWDNWVPGDWGYIENTKFEHGNEDPDYKETHQGLEGHNMAYSGDGVFAAYYRDSYNLDLDDNIEIVYNWRDEEDQKELTPKLKAALRRDPHDPKYEGGLVHASRYVPVNFGEPKAENTETKTTADQEKKNAHTEQEQKPRPEAPKKVLPYDLEADIDSETVLNEDSITEDESSKSWKICGEIKVNPNPETNPGDFSTITTCRDSEREYRLPLNKKSEPAKRELAKFLELSQKGGGFACITVNKSSEKSPIAPDKEDEDILHVMEKAYTIGDYHPLDAERGRVCEEDPEISDELQEQLDKLTDLNPKPVGEVTPTQSQASGQRPTTPSEQDAYQKIVQKYKTAIEAHEANLKTNEDSLRNNRINSETFAANLKDAGNKRDRAWEEMNKELKAHNDQFKSNRTITLPGPTLAYSIAHNLPADPAEVARINNLHGHNGAPSGQPTVRSLTTFDEIRDQTRKIQLEIARIQDETLKQREGGNAAEKASRAAVSATRAVHEIIDKLENPQTEQNNGINTEYYKGDFKRILQEKNTETTNISVNEKSKEQLKKAAADNSLPVNGKIVAMGNYLHLIQSDVRSRYYSLAFSMDLLASLSRLEAEVHGEVTNVEISNKILAEIEGLRYRLVYNDKGQLSAENYEKWIDTHFSNISVLLRKKDEKPRNPNTKPLQMVADVEAQKHFKKIADDLNAWSSTVEKYTKDVQQYKDKHQNKISTEVNARTEKQIAWQAERDQIARESKQLETNVEALERNLRTLPYNEATRLARIYRQQWESLKQRSQRSDTEWKAINR